MALGQGDRAESLTYFIADGNSVQASTRLAWAWTDLAWLAIISGDRDRAGRLIREAYSEARSVTQPYLQAQLLLAWARVRAADSDGPGAGELGDRAGGW